MAGASDRPFLSVVIPVYNSAACIRPLAREIKAALDPLGWSYEVILVNDYSTDNSWGEIETICGADGRFKAVDFRRNFGQDNAILTGFRLSCGENVAVMDDDLQHHPRDLPVLLGCLTEAVDVVFADFQVRHQKLWKNAGSWLNGKIADWVLYKPPDVYLSPFKVIRSNVVSKICEYPGPKPHIDGLIFQCTWRVASVPVPHYPRFAGRGNYGFWRSVGVASRLLFSFSNQPIRLLIHVGALLTSGSIIAAVIMALLDFTHLMQLSHDAALWGSLALVMCILSGVQLLGIGLVGEYAGRIYLSISRKPQDSIRKLLNCEPEMSITAQQ